MIAAISRTLVFQPADHHQKAKKASTQVGRLQPKTLTVKKRAVIIESSSPDVYSTDVYRRRAWLSTGVTIHRQASLVQKTLVSHQFPVWSRN